MMILAFQFWAFLLCCLDTVQTYDMYHSSYCHQLLTFGLRQCRFFVSFFRQFYQSEKTDDISRSHQRFPPELTSEKRAQKFYTDEAFLTQIWVSASDWLKQVSQAALPTSSTDPDLGSDESSVWNFCARFSDFNSWGSQWWRCEMSSVISGFSLTVQKKKSVILNFKWLFVCMELYTCCIAFTYFQHTYK